MHLLNCSRLIPFGLAIFLLNDYCCALNVYIDRYETLNYKPLGRNLQRRSINVNADDRASEIKFRSHNRKFVLKLFPIIQSDVFAENHIIDVDGKAHERIYPDDLLYEGYLEDDPSSKAYGSLIDGIFDGHIVLGNGTSFTIEKASRYYSKDTRPNHFHSIIYADEMINHEKFRKKREANDENKIDGDDTDSGGCGLTKELYDDMRNFQRSFIDDDSYSYSSAYNSSLYEANFKTRSHLAHPDDDIHKENRIKRSLYVKNQQEQTREIRGRRLHDVRTCSIYLQTDQKLYSHIFYKEGNRDHFRTKEEIIGFLYNHIKAVNQIYEVSDFGGIRGINFAIQRITIYTPDSCMNGKAVNSDNPFCEENIDVSNYLNLNSQKDHSFFCLAYALTYRDFVGGTLGLAWVASARSDTAGGICQTHQRYSERGGGSRSLNTGIITLVNYGTRLPLRVSQLTLAHEIGHNFGSPHDFPIECQPGLPSGNFIMFASATSGDKPNNSKFSSCSVSNITEVLYEVLQQSPRYKTPGKKRNCFTEQQKSFCGNQIREPGEECDCGFTKQDCEGMGDACCTPRDEAPSEKETCKRKLGKRCSPSEGLCCNPASCSLYSQSDNRLCREESECQREQYCKGFVPECPESVWKRDGLPCQNTTRVCHKGACNGSICTQVGLKDCFLTEGRPEQLCFLACEKNGVCLSSAELPELKEFQQWGRKPGEGLLLHPGSPCNNYKGYCDIFRKCRSVDANGPLARLKSLVFDPETIKTMSQWVRENWWACVLIGIGILMLMALFVKCCAVHTPSTNPNKLPPAHLTDTLRHPGTLLRRGHQQHRPQRPNATPSRSNNPNRRNAPNTTTTRFTANENIAPTTVPTAPNLTINNSIAHQQSVPLPTNQIQMQLPPNCPPPPYTETEQLPPPPSNILPQALSATIPKPAALPGPPLPSSSLPLIPGLPIPGNGPKPGRRRPKQGHQSAQQQKKRVTDEKGTGTPHSSSRSKKPAK